MADVFVQSKIREGKVTLFVKRGCPYCRNAVEMLKRYSFVPGCLQVFDITGLEDAQDYLQQTTGQRTVPHVFMGRHCLGGLSDLENIEWKLPEMLRRLGVLQ
ncbi:glutaredoxin-1 [Nyctibius grandis]|uniref:glutaredoxin-1 n=1 Tax=Nyctibius grandis TaxID=48427 RepID=UPI0035BC57E5